MKFPSEKVDVVITRLILEVVKSLIVNIPFPVTPAKRVNDEKVALEVDTIDNPLIVVGKLNVATVVPMNWHAETELLNLIPMVWVDATETDPKVQELSICM